MQLILLFVLCFVAANASSSQRQTEAFPHDITRQSELTRLYNTPVVRAESLRRPLGSLSWMLGTFSHSGVRVTTDSGESWLIHKGDGFGRTSQTVVTDANHMSDRWRVVEDTPVHGRTVGDFVRAGGSTYSLLRDNCHHAADRMMSCE
uniref:Uncharacterized protein n=1 Tax=Callorhinchus milii TaxID=7868 RepID=V9LGM1_CALMI